MLPSLEDSNGEPVEIWEMVREEEFGAGDMTKSSQRSSFILAPFMHTIGYLAATWYGLSWQPRAVGSDFRKKIFRLLDFGGRSDPGLVPDYTLPILDVYYRTIRAVSRFSEGLRIFHEL